MLDTFRGGVAGAAEGPLAACVRETLRGDALGACATVAFTFLDEGDDVDFVTARDFLEVPLFFADEMLSPGPG